MLDLDVARYVLDCGLNKTKFQTNAHKYEAINAVKRMYIFGRTYFLRKVSAEISDSTYAITVKAVLVSRVQ